MVKDGDGGRNLFTYPPIPLGTDSIRILMLEPGEFKEDLVCTLQSVTFTAKPRYIALSYTWADPDHVSAKLPTSNGNFIKLNGNAYFPVQHNLCLALMYIRSRTHVLPLWADAICVNQSDLTERNAQVAIMGFIFRRAECVVGWLGVRPNAFLNTYDFGITGDQMRDDWVRGTGRMLAAALDLTGDVRGGKSRTNQHSTVVAGGGDRVGTTNIRYSPAPNELDQKYLFRNPYWTRMWIVQEVCLPRTLMFLYGPNLWTFEQLTYVPKEMAVYKSKFPPPTPVVGNENSIEKTEDFALRRLMDIRKKRFTDEMRLEKLIELFAKNDCSDIKDRIYALLGLACDVDSYSNGEDSRPAYETEQGSVKNSQRGIRVDYSGRFFDIWADVVEHMYFCARATETTSHVDDITVETVREDSSIKVVRFAGVVQAALNGQVENELRETEQQNKELRRVTEPRAEQDRRIWELKVGPYIQTKGYIAGEIISLGPSYNSFVASHQAEREWRASWNTQYSKPKELERLRQIEDAYSRKIINLDDTEIARIQQIESPSTLGRLISEEKYQGVSNAECNDKQTVDQALSGPIRFLGNNCYMGLVPAAANVGDAIVRFWACDVAIVMRRDGRAYRLVGRAHVADVINRKEGEDSSTLPYVEPQFSDCEGVSDYGSRGIYVDMDLPTLQKITA